MKKLLTAFCLVFLHCIVLAQNSPPKVIKYESPVYPPAAQATRTTGTVVVAIKVDNYGRVVSAKVESGSIFLAPSSEISAKKWIFAASNQLSTELKITFVYTIKINKDSKNNYRDTDLKVKFKKPYMLSITATVYPKINI